MLAMWWLILFVHTIEFGAKFIRQWGREGEAGCVLENRPLPQQRGLYLCISQIYNNRIWTIKKKKKKKRSGDKHHANILADECFENLPISSLFVCFAGTSSIESS